MSGNLETNPLPAPPRGETGEERGGGDASMRPAATQAGDGGADAAAVERIAEARRRRRFDRAEEEIEAALQRHPDSTGVLVQRAWLRREEGDPEGALSEFDAILRKEPDNEEALVGKAALLRARRSLGELEALLARALKQHPDSAALRNESGWFYLDTGRLDEAERAFGAVLAKEGENREALQGTVAVLRKLRKFGDAQAVLDRALRVHEHDRGLLCERAWVELEQDRLGPALAAIEAVLRADEAGKWFDGEHERHVAWKVFLQTELRDLDGAERTIRSALVHFPESALLRTDLGWVQFHRREYREALQTFESVPDSAPEQDSSLQGRIAALRAQGEFGAARRLADDAVLRLPKSAGIISERAWLALAMGDVAEARREFERLLKQTNDPRTHVNVAWTYLYGSPKDLAAAEAECRRALDLNPSSAEALGCLGVIAARRREPYQAEHHLRRSLELRPTSRTHADLAEVLIQDERYDEAGKEIEEALKIDPGDAHAHAQKGNLLLQRELPDQALPEFRRAVSLDPTDPDVHAALAAALMELGRDDEAETVLRAALRKGGWAGRWKLHLLLCQRLTRLGDDTGEKDHYRDALGEANRAIHAVPHHPAPHYHAGVVRFKLEDYPGALGSFRRCTELDPDDGDAILGAGKVRGVLRRERDRSRVSRAESWGLALLFSTMLVALWVLRVRTDKVDSNVFLTLNILLPGLLIASRMLPWLTHFRFTGLEVELSAPPAKDLLVTGPRGEVGFSRPPRVSV